MTRGWSWLPRPLDPLASFKAKVSVLVGGALLLASVTFWFVADWPFRYALLLALVVALVLTQLLAHGMTSPLREMTAAAQAMARGDYSIRVRASSRDEVGQLAAAFNAMSADLAAAEQYRRELIGNVSHELRTPISALHAVLENVVDGVAEPDTATMRTALSQTERLGRLVGDLLDLSKLEGGAIVLDLDTFDVAEFLREAVEHTHADVRTHIRVTPTDLVATGDTARLHQVVVNLLDNATRHAPSGSRVVVEAESTRNGLQIDVSDDGPGIAPAERERVFERFIRGGSTDGGTGLGLAIARWAVELHGGTIEVVDQSVGCRIRVHIPSGQDPSGHDPSGHIPTRQPHSGEGDTK
ncbi:ATP-binding protein [Antrihabitans sp. NCIMB 15449]|uniref:Signal transduction histidine-protein kinase/phosphatase MprB n=1 Tax=Antrihabitans spumae TaxID=3373370 RepID=A0ABW7JNB7_9NOCA